MKLSLPYLQERYEFWKREIGISGIWNPILFKDVEISIRPKCKSYNGLFCRRWLRRNGKRVLVDRIFIYENSTDFNPVFLDSLLVHEMIHQYIFQAKIKDTSTHGKVFKDFMKKINQTFPEKLSIHISDHNPSVPLKGPGNKLHRIILSWTEKDCYCCVINPCKINTFDRLIKYYKRTGRVKDYFWATSDDMYFDSYVRCTKTLHGVKKPIPEMLSFCKEHNVVNTPFSKL